MTPTQKLILSCSLTVLIGGGIMIWLLSRSSTAPSTTQKDTDTTTAFVQQPATAIDTAKDIEIIRAYYTFLLKDTSEWKEYQRRQRKYVTQTFIDNLSLYDEQCFDPVTRTENYTGVSLRTFRVKPLKGGWYRVSFFDSFTKEWISIPIRMVTDKEGKRKVGYITPPDLKLAASDSIFYSCIQKIQEFQPNAASFLSAFFRSYISTYLTIDLDASAYRKYLFQKFIGKKLKHNLREINGDGEHIYFFTALIGSTPDNSQCTILADRRKGWYKVVDKIANNYTFSLKVEKHNGHFFIMDIDEEEEADSKGPANCDIEGACFTIVEEMPQFPGGYHALLEYLSSHTVYPKAELKAGNSGRVILSFVVNKDGSITDIEVVRSASKGLDEEAVRVVRSMPLWEPGRNEGQPVRVRFMLPVTFKLE
ncbi:energy transducer TonB [Prevotella dentasini]|uniref:energy transducer TonB n=1 Tax=Prevotella dentasini TaxID=589537 RepID=UPI000A0728AC|nr:energy transducer TonB [Prevotella dentasini]